MNFKDWLLRVEGVSKSRAIAITLISSAFVTAICIPISGIIHDANIVMIYLISTFFIAVIWGRLASILSAFVNVISFDYFFVSPKYSLVIDDLQFLITFIVMLIVGLVTSSMAWVMREKIADISCRSEMNGAIQLLSRELFKAQTVDQVISASISSLQDPMQLNLSILLIKQSHMYSENSGCVRPYEEIIQRGETLITNEDGRSLIFIPIQTDIKKFGILIASDSLREITLFGRNQLLEAAADLIALALYRIELALSEEASKVQAATEGLKSSILASLSHDLHRPLTKIIELSKSLQNNLVNIDHSSQLALSSMQAQGKNLCVKVDNLLHVMKFETHRSTLEKHWQSVEDVIVASIQYFNSLSSYRAVTVTIDPQTPILFLDEVLLERVIYNLLDNAAKYSSINSTIEIYVRPFQNMVEVEVRDFGDGFVSIPQALDGAPNENKQDSNPGVLGLGLSICKTIIQSHGGLMWAENHKEGKGASVFFTIPILAIPSIK